MCEEVKDHYYSVGDMVQSNLGGMCGETSPDSAWPTTPSPVVTGDVECGDLARYEKMFDKCCQEQITWIWGVAEGLIAKDLTEACQ